VLPGQLSLFDVVLTLVTSLRRAQRCTWQVPYYHPV